MSSLRDFVRKPAVPGAKDPLRFARALIGDLVDKNLWPVALLLCIAIVAIPVLMTRGGGSDGAGVPAAAPQPDAETTKAVELIGPPTTRRRPSKQLDPFRQPKKKEKAAAAAGSIPLGPGSPSAAAPSAGTPSGGTPSTGAPSTGTPSTGTPSTRTPAVNPARVYYRTEVRWSQVESATARPISRLTPLGDAGERGVLYLGVSNRGYAVFVLSPKAQVEVSSGEQAGDTPCNEPVSCRFVGLKAGAKKVIIVPSSDGSKARRYHLEAVSIKRVVTSFATASRMHAKVHSKGRAVLREMLSDPLTAQVLDLLRYHEPSGQIVLAKGAKKTTK
jgi:hypothetical protein